jgi:hypothetical protein
MRDGISLAIEPPRRVALLNRTMTRWASVASENAGRERGTLAWYIGARQPLSGQTLEDLKAYRGVVNRTTREMIAFSNLPDTDARIMLAVQTMQAVSWANSNSCAPGYAAAGVELSRMPPMGG